MIPFDDDTIDRTLPAVPAPELPADPIAGRYRLGDEIARGGMGGVFAATDLVLRREVAVKVLHPNAGPAGGRRFVDEAGITGQLQHPGIPPVYDIGELPDGRPFLAMKLVKGQTLDQRLKVSPLPAGERDRLIAAFEDICQAVGYAHAHGVIHRDLKPANVMLGAFGEVLVMDWGLAKVLTSGGAGPRRSVPDNDITLGTEIRSVRDAADATSAGSFLGTPAYMPPEQAVGAVDRIDRRSDVFGLGGILCAILTGKPPYVGENSESTRQLAALAKLDAAFARLAECGADPEVVALCKQCLSVEPDARPANAAAVAGEMARLRTEAETRTRNTELFHVAATARATVERRRQRTLLRAVQTVSAVLMVGAGAATLMWLRAISAEAATREQLRKTEVAETAARKAADENQKLAEQKAQALALSAEIVHFFREVLFPSVPSQATGPKRTVDEAAEAAAAGIGTRFKGRPVLEAAVRTTLGEAFRDQGKYDKAEEQLTAALALRRQSLPETDPSIAESRNNLAGVLETRGRFEEAVKHYTAARDQFRTVYGPDAVETLTVVNNLGQVRWHQDRRKEAEAAFRHVLDRLAATGKADHGLTATVKVNLAGVLLRTDPAEAERLYREVLADDEQKLGPDHPYTLFDVNNLGVLYLLTERYADAEVCFRRVLVGLTRRLGADHPRTLIAAASLGKVLTLTGREDEAIRLFESCLRESEQRPNEFNRVLLRGHLGLLLAKRGDPNAGPHLRAMAGPVFDRREQVGVDHRQLLRDVLKVLADMEPTADWADRLARLTPETAPMPRAGK